MRVLIVFALFIFAFINSKCNLGNNNNCISLDYCKILDDDQKYVNWYKTSKTYYSDKKKRHSIFVSNFYTIINYAKYCDLPELKLENALSDNCEYRAVDMTFTHIAQTDISILFMKKNKTIIKDQIRKGKLPKQILSSAFFTMLYTNEIDINNIKKLKSFIFEFGLENEIIQGENLINIINSKG